jgi:ribosomal protein S18 acetylase RimI-like enzyme
MTVTLRPLRPEEFQSWSDHQRTWYTADLTENGGMPPAAALAKATEDSSRAFPDGFSTPGNVVLAIEEEAAVVGSVWFAPREQHGLTYAFLFSIEIDESQRGRGLGRLAMEELETEVGRRGFARLELNVFAGNSRARSLYRSLGFAETSVHMGKDLG